MSLWTQYETALCALFRFQGLLKACVLEHLEIDPLTSSLNSAIPANGAKQKHRAHRCSTIWIFAKKTWSAHPYCEWTILNTDGNTQTYHHTSSEDPEKVWTVHSAESWGSNCVSTVHFDPDVPSLFLPGLWRMVRSGWRWRKMGSCGH